VSRVRIPFALGGAAFACAAALSAASSAAAATEAVSENWAGYAVTGPRYQRISGSWIVPKVHCSAGTKKYSGVWLGLGGFTSSSQALEQVGTDQNCGSNGRAKYTAWYELVPADPVTLKLKVHPGDKISASVTVSGSSAKLHLKNRTEKTSFSATKHLSSPDITSAEWIVEAPAACDDAGACTTLPLANFGTASLGSAVATTKKGNAFAISKGPWSVTKLRLSDPAGGGAVASGLSSDGRSFKVSYRQQARWRRQATASHRVGRR
jgi:hypothetical protein